MDRKRLNDYIYLKREIAKNEKRLEKLKEELTVSGDIVGDSVNQYSSGRAVPLKIQGISESDFTLPLRIIELQELIEDGIAKAQEEIVEIEKYIQTIPDAKTRGIFRARFIDGKDWERVGKENYISPDHARKIVRQYGRES